MNRHTRILAGTALATLLAAGTGWANAAPLAPLSPSVKPSAHILLAQADPSAEELLLPPAEQPQAEQSQEEQPKRKKRQAERQAAEEAAQPEAQGRAESAQERRKKRQAAEEAVQQEGQDQADSAQERRKKRQAERQAAEEAAQQDAQGQAESAQERRKKRQAERQAAEEAAKPEGKGQAEGAAERPKKSKAERKAAEEAAKQEGQPQEESAAERLKKRQAERKAAEEAAKPEGKGQAESAAEQQKKSKAERKAAEKAAQQQGESQQEAQPQEESAAERLKKRQAERKAAEEAAKQQEGQKPAAQPEGEPAEDTAQPAEEGKSAKQRPSESGKPETPVLDSQKEQAAPATEGDGSDDNRASRKERERRRQQAEEAAPAGPPPKSDQAAQKDAQPREIKPVTEERGKRRERAPDDEPRRRERPKGVDIVKDFKDRIIVELGNQYFVESNERPRLTRNAREVYYEDLPRGRTREVVVRRDGSQLITIRDRYGDVIRRSRLTPEGREIVMVYVDEDHYDRVREWRDPGLDLPPMRLEIPVDEYILDAERVRAPDDYYTFLEQPPVERVERLYSIDEVKRSARIRDKTRRIDLDTLTFEFGSADIPDDQIAKLEGVAEAIQRLLDKNPAETFLIEGHTDAVGSDMSNLALSDRRAESVADALTNVFDIPPENLATQGYGEQYLKVNTQAPERQNRRVAIRRVTPLVAPVASAK